MASEPSLAGNSQASATEAIGVDLGGTKMLVGVTRGAEVLYRSEQASFGRSADELLGTLVSELELALAARPQSQAIGLGLPCTIDRDRGVAISAVNLPIADVPIRELISKRLGMHVSLDNDANAAALAEQRFGAARGKRNAIVLTVGTGIGGGLIINGELYRGASGAGAELGHMVIDADGPACQGNCPNHGCAEAVASGTALNREALLAAERHPNSALGRILADGGDVGGQAATRAAQAGDEVAREVVERIAGRLGALVSGLANVFEPDVIVLGGGVLAAGELILEPVRAQLRARALPPMNQTPVTAALLGVEAGMIGAATMAAEEKLAQV